MTRGIIGSLETEERLEGFQGRSLRKCPSSKDITGNEEVMNMAILRNYVLGRGT